MLTSTEKITKILNGAVPDIVSFDVFDTLLIRKTDPPENTKRFAARIAVERKLVDISIVDLLTARNQIEKQLREQNRRIGFDAEVSVQEIFSELSQMLIHNASLTEKLIAVEFEVESMLIRPMPGMLSVLRALAGRCRIIAISDTYLPRSFVERLLRKAGYDDALEMVFCSSDYLLNKGSGRLFGTVMEKMGIGPHQMLHIGDNFISDYFIPKSKGILSHLLYDQWNLQRRFRLNSITSREHKSDYWFGFSVHSSLSEGSEKINASEKYGFYEEWGRGIVAPLLVSFIHGLAEKVRTGSVDSLYFMAREGFLLKKMFDVFWQSMYPDEPPRTVYLCISRYTAFISSIREMGDRERILAFNGVRKVESFLTRLGLRDMTRLAGLLEEFNLKLSDDCTDKYIMRKMDLLFGDDRFLGMLLSRAKNMRSALRAYLKEHGFFTDNRGTSMLVDIGWLGTIQDSLEHAFRDDASFPNLEGAYLGLNSPVYNVANRKAGLIYDYRHALPEEMAIGLFRESLEFTCRSLHETTMGYQRNSRGKMMPVFSSNNTSLNERHRIASGILEIQKGVMHYLAEYASMVKMTGITSHAMSQFAVQYYDSKISFPNFEIIDVLSMMENSEDFGSEEKRGIVGSLSIFSLFRPSTTLRNFINTPWREALLAKSRIPFLKDAYFALKRFVCWKRIAPEVIENNDISA
ncbi:MAG: HAD hydrolase-like protein [Desulfuromonadaceae bacterium]|nr:HAD hydrolase-like protein [Desulfuromonadaceae bacterium]